MNKTREILFRGKDATTNKWLVGDLRQRYGCYPSIIHRECNDGKIYYCETAVQEDSVGQSTELCDVNGHIIYEGDIVEWRFLNCVSELTHRGVIEWHQGGFVFNVVNDNVHDAGWYGISDLNTDTESDVVIIGNIFDNKDLVSNYIPVADKYKQIIQEIPNDELNK